MNTYADTYIYKKEEILRFAGREVENGSSSAKGRVTESSMR